MLFLCWLLARAIMTQYSRYGSAKGTTWAYWERIKSVWKRLWVPESSHVTGMCNSCKLIVLSIGASILFIAHAIIALPLRFVELFALILRPHCAATENVTLVILVKVLFRCFQLLHNAFMLRFHLRLTFFPPRPRYTLFSSERRPAALVLSILKGVPGFCA